MTNHLEELKKAKSLVFYTARRGNTQTTHMCLGDPNGPGVDMATGKPTKLSMLEGAKAEVNKLLTQDWEITHTGAILAEGAVECIDWTADYIKKDGDMVYAEWHKGSDGYSDGKVRGSLERTVRLNGEVTVVSSKKTYRKDGW